VRSSPVVARNRHAPTCSPEVDLGPGRPPTNRFVREARLRTEADTRRAGIDPGDARKVREDRYGSGIERVAKPSITREY